MQADISVWESSSMMDTDLITRLNTLWNPIYPHLAQWLGPWMPQNTGHMLKISPFSNSSIIDKGSLKWREL